MNHKNLTNLKLINADTLKYLAMLFMLIDHMWATIIPGNQWMNFIGRLAFPIFAFQISEGFIHTSNFKKYALRLFIFALISEIPFNLFYSGSVIFPFHQNVLFTLLLGLLAIKAISNYENNKNAKTFLTVTLALLGIALLAIISLTDYGLIGVLTVVMFYVSRNLKFSWAYQLIAMYLLHAYFFTGMFIPINIGAFNFEFEVQGFAVFSLLLIWLYNGKKGKKTSSPLWKYSMYIFYPLHMLILYFITTYIM